MERRWFLAVLLAAAPGEAAVSVSIRLPEAALPETAAKLARTEPLLERLLADGALPAQGPFVGPRARFLKISPAGRRSLPPKESLALQAELRRLWGQDLTLTEETGEEKQARQERLLARLDVGASRRSQDLHYDAALTRSAAPAVTAAPASPRATSFLSAPPRGARPAPPAPAAKSAQGVRWGRVGIEVLKGAGETVKSIFTWKGLATAAAAVAIVTVAPVAVYGFLAVGAAVGGYTIGKALYDGVKAHRAGNAEGVYAASREFGKGALTLGLSLYGARHTPTNLRPHLPKAGEFKALLSSMDDEAVVAATLLEKFKK